MTAHVLTESGMAANMLRRELEALSNKLMLAAGGMRAVSLQEMTEARNRINAAFRTVLGEKQ
ncbi:MAG: hypothetical protein ABSC37_03085 [Xanthobacteraceae bacterium]